MYIGKYRIRTGVIFLTGILIVIILGYFLKKFKFLNNNQLIIDYYGYSITIFSILLAALQFWQNNIWNKKQTALTVTNEIKHRISDHFKILEKEFKYYHKNDREDKISVEEIHQKICKKNKGSFARDRDGNLILDDKNGVIIKDAITSILDAFEFLSAGIYHNIYDKSIIKALYKTSFIRMYCIFGDYIEHYKKMYPSSEGRIWINFVELAKEFEAERVTPRSEKSA